MEKLQELPSQHSLSILCAVQDVTNKHPASQIAGGRRRKGKRRQSLKIPFPRNNVTHYPIMCAVGGSGSRSTSTAREGAEETGQLSNSGPASVFSKDKEWLLAALRWGRQGEERPAVPQAHIPSAEPVEPPPTQRAQVVPSWPSWEAPSPRDDQIWWWGAFVEEVLTWPPGADVSLPSAPVPGGQVTNASRRDASKRAASKGDGRVAVAGTPAVRTLQLPAVLLCLPDGSCVALPKHCRLVRPVAADASPAAADEAPPSDSWEVGDASLPMWMMPPKGYQLRMEPGASAHASPPAPGQDRVLVMVPAVPPPSPSMNGTAHHEGEQGGQPIPLPAACEAVDLLGGGLGSSTGESLAPLAFSLPEGAQLAVQLVEGISPMADELAVTAVRRGMYVLRPGRRGTILLPATQWRRCLPSPGGVEAPAVPQGSTHAVAASPDTRPLQPGVAAPTRKGIIGGVDGGVAAGIAGSAGVGSVLLPAGVEMLTNQSLRMPMDWERVGSSTAGRGIFGWQVAAPPAPPSGSGPVRFRSRLTSQELALPPGTSVFPDGSFQLPYGWRPQAAVPRAICFPALPTGFRVAEDGWGALRLPAVTVNLVDADGKVEAFAMPEGCIRRLNGTFLLPPDAEWLTGVFQERVKVPADGMAAAGRAAPESASPPSTPSGPVIGTDAIEFVLPGRQGASSPTSTQQPARLRLPSACMLFADGSFGFPPASTFSVPFPDVGRLLPPGFAVLADGTLRMPRVSVRLPRGRTWELPEGACQLADGSFRAPERAPQSKRPSLALPHNVLKGTEQLPGGRFRLPPGCTLDTLSGAPPSSSGQDTLATVAGTPLPLRAFVMPPRRPPPLPQAGVQVLLSGELRLPAVQFMLADGQSVFELPAGCILGPDGAFQLPEGWSKRWGRGGIQLADGTLFKPPAGTVESPNGRMQLPPGLRPLFVVPQSVAAVARRMADGRIKFGAPAPAPAPTGPPERSQGGAATPDKGDAINGLAGGGGRRVTRPADAIASGTVAAASIGEMYHTSRDEDGQTAGYVSTNAWPGDVLAGAGVLRQAGHMRETPSSPLAREASPALASHTPPPAALSPPPSASTRADSGGQAGTLPSPRLDQGSGSFGATPAFPSGTWLPLGLPPLQTRLASGASPAALLSFASEYSRQLMGQVGAVVDELRMMAARSSGVNGTSNRDGGGNEGGNVPGDRGGGGQWGGGRGQRRGWRGGWRGQ
eukprot:jgi/Mesvir1/14254/Mv09690-RA.1